MCMYLGMYESTTDSSSSCLYFYWVKKNWNAEHEKFSKIICLSLDFAFKASSRLKILLQLCILQTLENFSIKYFKFEISRKNGGIFYVTPPSSPALASSPGCQGWPSSAPPASWGQNSHRRRILGSVCMGLPIILWGSVSLKVSAERTAWRFEQ